MKSLPRIYLCRSIWIIVTVGGLHAMVDCSHANHELFDEGVIQKWKDYEAFSHSLQGTSRSHGIIDGKPQESIKRYKQNHKCAIYIESPNRESSLLICSLLNPDYMATINLSKSNPENAVLSNYTQISRSTEAPTLINGVFCATSRHFCYNSASKLRQVVLDPFFKVTKTVKEIQDGQELIRVDHTYKHALHLKDNVLDVHTHGTLWLDPSRFWCIRRMKTSAETTSHNERITKIETELVCEMIDHPSGFPILKTRTNHHKRLNYKNNRTYEGTMKTDYELEVNDNLPDGEFTLSAFGLPEPGSEPMKKPIPLFVWILVAASVCATLALGFRYLARRTHPKSGV